MDANITFKADFFMGNYFCNFIKSYRAFLSCHQHIVKKVAKWQAYHVCRNIKFAHQNWRHKSCDWPQFT